MLVNVSDKEEEHSLKLQFRELVEHYSKNGRKRIASYLGELSDYKMNNILFLVESQMEQSGASQAAIKRLFFIMIEALQNVIYHGEQDTTGFTSAFAVVGKDKNLYTLHAGNLILNKNLESVKMKMQQAKAMDERTIRIKTREILFRKKVSVKEAGLGLLTIAQKSNHTVDFEFFPFNNSMSLLSFQASVLDS